jgi:hypothetical protein
VGPTRHRKLSLAALEMVRERYKLIDCEIRKSETPWRTP